MAVQISRAFKDISLSFTRHPVTNDVTVLKNEDAIKKSVINLCRTRINDRFFNDLLGTSIEDSFFETNLNDNSSFLEREITRYPFESNILTRSNPIPELVPVIITVFINLN